MLKGHDTNNSAKESEHNVLMLFVRRGFRNWKFTKIV